MITAICQDIFYCIGKFLKLSHTIKIRFPVLVSFMEFIYGVYLLIHQADIFFRNIEIKKAIVKEVAMNKDTLVVNIYNKIHNKKPLTMDDLRYLAEYAPECFEKTCSKVINTMPEAKPIMEPVEIKAEVPTMKPSASPSRQYNIDDILENIIRLEANELPLADLDADNVKNLLGNLYMELLFSHSDKETLASMLNKDTTSLFDAKV